MVQFHKQKKKKKKYHLDNSDFFLSSPVNFLHTLIPISHLQWDNGRQKKPTKTPI